MTNFEYIIKQAKFFHFKGWEEGELKKCLGMLAGLSRGELVALHTNKWIRSGKTLKEEIFKILFMDQLGKREERIKGASTNDLINEFEEKQTGNIALIRQELRTRYKDNLGDDRIKIAAAFNRSTKGDQQWVESQVRKEMYGSTGNNNVIWKKKSWK